MSQREGIWILTRDLLISRGWTLKKKKIFFECASPNSRPHKMPGSALGPRSSTACACREQPSRACTRGQEAPGWRGAPGDCALGELLDGCAAAGPPPSADASSSGGRAASPCPSACSQRPHRDGTDSVPCEHLSARTEPAGRLTERLLPGSLLDLIKKKKKNSLRHLVATFTARPQGSLEARWSWRAGEGRWPSCTADTLHKRRRPVRRVWDDGSVPGGPSLLHEPFP